MFCPTAGRLPTCRVTREATVIASCVALLSVVALGFIAPPARAAEDPLLAAVPATHPAPSTGQWVGGPCAYDTDNSVSRNHNEQQRYAVNCLINEVRAKAGLNRLSFCAFHTYDPASPTGNACPNYFGAPLSIPQMSGLNIAAQRKAQDVMRCTDSLLPVTDPNRAHYACKRQFDYWPKDPAAPLCAGMAPWPCAPWFLPRTPTYSGWDPRISEVLAWGSPSLSPRAAVDAWLKSTSGVDCRAPQTSTSFSKHRELILCPIALFSGVGVSTSLPGDSSKGLLMPAGATGHIYAAYIS